MSLDFDADAGGVGEDVELLDSHLGPAHPIIIEANIGDRFGQGLDQIDMAGADDPAHAVHQRFVTHHIAEPVAQLALALGYLHSLKVAYRDLKPENVLLRPDGHICLADFGLCKENVTSESELTEVCGTEEYVAPEMVLAQHTGYGLRVDWWALGILTYEMLTGQPPFSDDDIPF